MRIESQALRTYGVVCDDEGNVDASATRDLHEQLSAGRPDPLPTFDMGPPLETILARCEEDTGLPAPTPPVAML